MVAPQKMIPKENIGAPQKQILSTTILEARETMGFVQITAKEMKVLNYLQVMWGDMSITVI